MSFVDPFVENPTTASNLESFGSQADSRSLNMLSPSNAIQIAEQDEEDKYDEIAMSQEQPHNFKRQPDKKRPSAPEGKKVVLPNRHGSVTGIERAGKRG
ncbi:hypothetical protein PoB_000177300 [Plakobranchus ocellatus]|uniref:Uncharacterized protein n=1 Tax=Plakobranchus ocellatus TaxID=259542 RepID=A0AAV3XYG4_9GAST|nr:hypothetical protein PoB_000177300 [Plakobranchus ocellatus]